MNATDKTAELQEIGRIAMSGIAEMVAALSCDYDRLDELRDERDGLKADWHSWKCGNGTYDFIKEDEYVEDGLNGPTYHNLGNGQDEASAWRDLFAQLHPDEAEELAELEASAGECESTEDAQERIQEDPLSIQVRSGWVSVGEEMRAEEFEILLSTGGPAVRIRGELDEHLEPSRAWLETQDWFTPWTQYIGGKQATILEYCRQFYFGE